MSRPIPDGMKFAMIPEWILLADISAQALRLFGLLNLHADEKGESYYSRKRLARELHCKSPCVIDRAVKELKAIGAIEVQQRRDDSGDLTSSLYTVRYSPEVLPQKIRPSIEVDATGSTREGPTGSTSKRIVIRPIFNETQYEVNKSDLGNHDPQSIGDSLPDFIKKRFSQFQSIGEAI